jgi:hypothetical protein
MVYWEGAWGGGIFLVTSTFYTTDCGETAEYINKSNMFPS